MLLLRRIFTASIPFIPIVPSLLLNKQVYHFSKESSNRTYLKQLHSKIVTDHRKVKPDALIKMIHHTHFKSKQNSLASIFTATEIGQIIDNLSSSSFQLTHQDLTLLLQTISSFPKYAHYTRDNQFMRLLVKRFNSMHLMSLNNRYVFRFLNILQKMRFPTLIISKYVNIFVNKYQQTKNKQNPITHSDYLKFFICILQMRYIPVEYVTKLYNNKIKNKKLSYPKDLCYLYYAYKTLQKSLQAKITYFSNKIRLHQLVFNPYSAYNGADQVPSQKQQQNTNKQKSEQAQHKIKQLSQLQKQKMRQSSQTLIAQMRKQINIQKLKQQICKHYQFEKYPMQISTALLVKDIKQLQPVIQQLFKKHYKSMQVMQFISLLPTIPEPQRAQFYQQYTKQQWNNISLYYKLNLLKANSQLCNHPITKSQLIQILQQSQSISPQQFQYITSLITQYIKPDDQLEILNAIQAIADKKQ